MQDNRPTETRTEEQIALERARDQMRAAFNAKAPGAMRFAGEYHRAHQLLLKNTRTRIH